MVERNYSRSVYVLTGANSGMGLHVAEALADLPDAHVIAGVRKPDDVKKLRTVVSEEKLTVLRLDLDDLDSVSLFAAQVVEGLSQSDELSSIICNAGLQILGSKEVTSAGVERTFQVNVLSHFFLVEFLSEHLKVDGSVVTVGSGTHNPADKLASRFGFRGGFFPTAAKVAAGDLGQTGSDVQLGMDRYATSKLCAILYAQAMAKGGGFSPRIGFYAFDPGLMPGTRLARERSLVEKFGWRFVLPLLQYVVSGVSSSKKSGKALVQQCVVERRYDSGSYIDFAGNPAPRSELSNNDEEGRRLVEHCRLLLDGARVRRSGEAV